MNIVEFALKIKDLASGQLHQFGTSSQRIFSNAQRYTDNLIAHNRKLAKSYDDVGASMKKSQQGAGGFPVGNLVKGGMIAGAIVGAVKKSAEFIGSSISAGMERQKIQTSFNVLTGSRESGQALTKQLVDLQKKTILGSEVFSNAQTMLGFGFKDTEVLDNLRMLGDVSMGDAGKLQSLTLAFSQIRAAGKLAGQDLLQLINAGFNPLEQMAQRTGKSMGQLKEEMSQGGISFQDVQQAFRDATSAGGKFNNMLETIAQTPAGKMAQLRGAWDEFKISAGQAFMPLVTLAVDFANKMLPLTENLITPISNGVQQLIGWIQSLSSETGGFMDYWNMLKELYGEHILPYAEMLWSFVSDMVGSLFDFIKNSQLLKDLFGVLSKFAGFIYDSFKVVVAWLKDLFDNVVMPILNGIEAAYRFVKDIFGSDDEIEIKVKAKRTTEEKKVTQENTDIIKSIAGTVRDVSAGVNKTEKATASGGQKIINITVQKFMDALNITTNTMDESVKEIEDRVTEVFARILLGGATA